MGGPGLATKHLWMRVPMTEFPDTTNFAACGGYRAEIGFCRFLWLRMISKCLIQMVDNQFRQG
jgi:hypothetical protein